MGLKLFDENSKYTVAGMDLDAEVDVVLKPLFDKYIRLDVSPRAIALLMILTVNDIQCESIIGQTVERESLF